MPVWHHELEDGKTPAEIAQVQFSRVLVRELSNFSNFTVGVESTCISLYPVHIPPSNWYNNLWYKFVNLFNQSN